MGSEPFNVRKHFEKTDRQNAADLAEAERLGIERGMETYDPERLRQLVDNAPCSRPSRESFYRYQYYSRFPEWRTLEEFAKHLLELAVWED